MKRRMIALAMAFMILGLLLSGCEGKTVPEGTSESGELKLFQEWETDIPFQLLNRSAKVDVTVRSSFNTDQEAVRKEAAARTDIERIEALFPDQEMRWVKCTADLLLAEDAESFFSDLSFMCYLEPYPQRNGGAGLEYSSSSTGAEMSGENTAVMFAFETAEDSHSCRATLYGYLPAEDDSYVLEIARCVKGGRNFVLPELPDESVLCWKIPKIE